MGNSQKGNADVWRPRAGKSDSPEDVLPTKDQDYPAAIAREAAREGISVETYLHMHTNQRQLYRLKRMIRAGNEMNAAERLRNPKRAEQMDAQFQAQINGLLGLNPDIDPVAPEPRNRGGAPKGNKNASKRKTTPLDGRGTMK